MSGAPGAPAPRRKRPLRIVAIGNSHLAAIIKGVKGFREANPQQPVKFSFVQLNNAEFRPPLKEGKFNPTITKVIEDAEADVILSCVAGNAHNVVGLVNHPTPFDFILPEEPELELNEAADVLPFELLKAHMKEVLRGSAFRTLAAMKDAVRVPILHLESPPPIASADYIIEGPETVFGERLKELGVAPASLRYKLWRLHSALVRDACTELGIHYVPVPKSVQANDGMLIESCWGNATHGNELFGHELLTAAIRQFDQLPAG